MQINLTLSVKMAPKHQGICEWIETSSALWRWGWHSPSRQSHAEVSLLAQSQQELQGGNSHNPMGSNAVVDFGYCRQYHQLTNLVPPNLRESPCVLQAEEKHKESQMQVTCRDMPLLTQSKVPKLDFQEEDSYRNGTNKKKGMIHAVQDLPREDVLHWK